LSCGGVYTCVEEATGGCEVERALVLGMVIPAAAVRTPPGLSTLDSSPEII
jgi:hypothetical protein